MAKDAVLDTPETTVAAGVPLTWMQQAISENPMQILEVNPDDATEILIRPERNVGRAGHVPDIGDKSLSEMIANMEEHTNEDARDFGQLQPGAATFNEAGTLDLYFGFRRARAVQTRNVARAAAGMLPILYKVMVTDRVLTEDEINARSLAENSIRLDPTPMQISEVVTSMQAKGKRVVDIAKAIGKSIGAVSTYSRFSLLPANARKALNTPGKMNYSVGEDLVGMLPKGKELAEDADGSLLASAQDKIAKHVDKLLEKGGGAVKSSDSDKAARDAGGASKQRTTKQVLNEVGAYLESDAVAGSPVAKRLQALEKFIAGGSMKAFVKAIG